jgi:quercetin dioxygenase-like cupin family protein
MFSQANSNNGIAAVPNVGVDNSVWSQTPLANFVITGEATQGKAAVMEAVQRKGQEPPRHNHPETDETFYVIEGKMTFNVAGQTISAPAGTTVFIERGQEHSFVVETDTANTLILLIPAPTEKVQARA